MTEKLSFGEKTGYALGDMAANFVFQAMLALQLDFYTHTFGLTAAQAGTLFLVVGLGVACLNPVMGVIADQTNSRWGKFRPWLLWTSLPFGVICVLTFTTPNISPGAKVIYAWTTYILLRVIYTMNNVPYATLNAVMTSDPDERNSISTYRQVAANSAGFIVAALAIPMVRVFGHGNDALGYQLTMGLLSVLSVIFFIIAFFTSKERIQPSPQQQSSLSQDMSDLFSNLPVYCAVHGHAVLFRGHRGTRQCDAALLPLCLRQRRSLFVVQRLWPGFAAGWRCLLDCGNQAHGQAISVYCQHDAGRRVQCGAV